MTVILTAETDPASTYVVPVAYQLTPGIGVGTAGASRISIASDPQENPLPPSLVADVCSPNGFACAATLGQVPFLMGSWGSFPLTLRIPAFMYLLLGGSGLGIWASRWRGDPIDDLPPELVRFDHSNLNRRQPMRRNSPEAPKSPLTRLVDSLVPSSSEKS